MKTLAVIPARGGSKRLPRKNVLPLGGKPLIAWSVEFALTSGLFDKTIVSTDDPEILDTALTCGASSYGMRPAELANDTASTVDVLIHELDRAEAAGDTFDLIALLQPTTPFRTKQDWSEAFDLLASHEAVPSVVGVTRTQETPYHMFDFNHGALRPLFPEGLKMRSQDVPETVVVLGAMYLCRTEVLRSERSLFSLGTRGVVIEAELDRIDIDTAADFDRAQTLLANHAAPPSP